MRHRAATAARAASAPAAKRSSSRTAHEFCDLRERAIGGTAAGFDEATSRGAHFLRSLWITKKFNPGYANIFGALNLDGGARGDEPRSNLREILHRRAEHGNFPEGRGFENIVSAGRDQRAADEYAVGNAIKGRKFADAIHQYHRNIFRNRAVLGASSRMRWAWDRELRASDEFAMRFVNELGGRFEAFRLSRSEDQERFGILPLQCSKRDESEGFLCGDHAACNDDWRAAATPSLRFQPIRERCGRGKLQI